MRLTVGVIVILSCSALPLRAQPATDSLEARLPAAAGPERLAVLADLVEAAHRDDPERAIGYGREALALLARYPDADRRRRVLYYTGQAHLVARRPDSAQAYVARLAALDGPLDRAQAALLEGWLHVQRDEADAAETAFTKVLGLIEPDGYWPGVAAAHQGLGVVYDQQADYDEAERHYEQARTHYQALGDRRGVADALMGLGSVHQARGALAQALDYYFRALPLSEARGDQLGVARALSGLGVVHWMLDELDEALGFYERAYALYEEQGDALSVATTLNGIALVRGKQGDLDAAFAAYTRALAAAEAAGDRHLVALFLMNMGLAQATMEEYGAAERTLQRAQTLYRDLDDPSGNANATYYLGRFYRERGRLPEALAALDEALLLGTSIGNIRLVEAVYRHQTDILEQQGRYAEALAAHRAFKATADSVTRVQQQEALAELQAEYQSEEQQRRIELLEREQRAQRTRVIALLVGLTLLALIVLLLVRQTRLRRRALAAVEQAQRETEEKAAEVERANAKLEQADELKTRFFTNVSHELRTPLTLTIGPLEDLQTGAHGDLPASAQGSVGLALRNSRRLLRLINQLLDIAKLEAGELKLDRRPLDLGPFTEAIALAFVPLAERRRIAFAYDLPEAPVVVSADGEALEQVIVNLLSNAFKFTPEGGAITVSLAAEAGEARLAVEDDGPGIAASVLEHLFERFYQVDESASDVQAGTGVGLALARDLAELHGGTISVESTVGAGSRFTVALPLTREATNGQAAPRLALAPEALFADAGEHGEADDGEEDASAEDRTTVLIVDDNADIRRYVRSHLDQEYRVVEAADGEAGVEMARQHLPDCIVSDVMMPRLDGFGLVRALRSDEATDFLPIILLTAKATEEDKLSGLGEGADDYLTKPFNVRELRARIENLIQQRRRLRARFGGGGVGAPVPDASPAPTADPPASATPALGTADTEFLDAVRAAAQTALGDEDFTVEALAEVVGQSRSNLHRRLREVAGVTPTALIRDVRLSHAAGLLASGAGNVSEVAYGVGFKSISHFSRVFGERYGVAPSAYRG